MPEPLVRAGHRAQVVAGLVDAVTGTERDDLRAGVLQRVGGEHRLLDLVEASGDAATTRGLRQGAVRGRVAVGDDDRHVEVLADQLIEPAVPIRVVLAEAS